jgi:hypothetical protein
MPLSVSIEIKLTAPYVKSLDQLSLEARVTWGVDLLKAVTLKEIERIFAITDALGISREALVIPLRPDSPGRVRRIAGGKLEIVVERAVDFDQWLNGLENQLRLLGGKAQG